MENFEYNKQGQVFSCKSLDSVEGTDLIPEKVKSKFREYFNKKCYFKSKSDSTLIGIVRGIEINTKIYEIYWIIENIVGEGNHYISCDKNLNII